MYLPNIGMPWPGPGMTPDGKAGKGVDPSVIIQKLTEGARAVEEARGKGAVSPAPAGKGR